MADVQLISQGAEGKVYFSTLFGKQIVIKERLSKKYRVKELDIKLNKQRLLQEARCMVRCRRAGVITPCIYIVDPERNQLHIERILGQTIKEIFRSECIDGNKSECSRISQR